MTLIIGPVKIFRKDLLELATNFKGILLIFVLPSLLLIVVGHLNTRVMPIKILIAGTPSQAWTDNYNGFIALVREIAGLEVTEAGEIAADPLGVMESEGYDLLLNMEGSEPDEWLFYTAATNFHRIIAVETIAARLGLLVHNREAFKELDGSLVEISPLLLGLTYGIMSLNVPVKYYPQAFNESLQLLPFIMSWIIVFTAFILTTPCLIREKNTRTLDVILTAPYMRPISIFIGKSLLPLTACVFQMLIMLLIAQQFYHIYPKPGAIRILIILICALSASTFAGIAVSSSVSNQSQSVMVAAIYFIASTMLSGLFYDIEQGSMAIQWLSKAFPLTYLYPGMASWLFGGQLVPFFADHLKWLLLQCAAYGAIAGYLFHRFLKRI